MSRRAVGSSLLSVVLATLFALAATGPVASGARSRINPAGRGGGLAAEVFRASGLTIPTGYSNNGSAANQAAARRDADLLLTEVVLPAGAKRLTSEPAGDNDYLKPLQPLESDTANALADEWWQLPITPPQMLRFEEANPPPRARLVGAGGAANLNTGTGATSVSFQWPPIAGVLGDRSLTVTATLLPNGETGVLLESQSDWVVLRPSSERIPLSVRSIKLTSAVPRGRSPSIALSVTGRSQVRAVVRLINSLPVAQPVVYFCPGNTDLRVIRMTFQAARGAPVAVLTYMDFRPWLNPSIACRTIGLTIAGHAQPPLVGGDFLQTLAKLLGRSLV